MSALVIVPEPVDFDLSDAKRFGRLECLFPHKKSRVSMFSHALSADIDKALDDVGFVPARDYILVAGHQGILSMIIGVAAARYGHLNLLVFNAIARVYEVQVVGDLSRAR